MSTIIRAIFSYIISLVLSYLIIVFIGSLCRGAGCLGALLVYGLASLFYIPILAAILAIPVYFVLKYLIHPLVGSHPKIFAIIIISIVFLCSLFLFVR